MPTTRIPKTNRGRPTLGKRDAFLVKLSEDDGQLVRLLAKVDGRTFQDVLGPIISAALAEVDVDALLEQAERQGVLDYAS
jgi:hypothetical protein